MGMSKGGSAPKAPDPAKVAAAQAGLNKDTALTQQQINMMNEYGPGGSSVYNQTGVDPKTGVPTYSRTISLSPQQQEAFDQQSALRARTLNTASGGVDRINAALERPALAGDDATRQRVEQSLFDRYQANLAPLQDKQQKAIEQQLANEGFSRGNTGYSTAMDEFSRSRDAANLDAARESVLQGGTEQSRLFGIDQAARMQPLQEQQALLGLAGGVDVPQFGATPQSNVAGTDITGPMNTQYQSQVNAYNQQQQQQNALMGSIFGLAGDAMFMSDPKVKEAKEPVSMAGILKKVEGLPVESWQNKGGDGQRRVGPYADDWARSFGGDGHMIDSQQAFGVSMAAIKALADKVSRLERR